MIGSDSEESGSPLHNPFEQLSQEEYFWLQVEKALRQVQLT